MSYSPELQKKIEEFADEQSQYYLESAEKGYLVELKHKGKATVKKLEDKMKSITGNPVRKKEAKDDLILFMSDFISDLIDGGMSEQEAFEKAKYELNPQHTSQYTMSLEEKIKKHYEFFDPNQMETIGLYYASGVIIGAVLGAFVGLLLGKFLFSEIEFWIPVVTGAVSGILLGVGVGMLMNASIIKQNKL